MANRAAATKAKVKPATAASCGAWPMVRFGDVVRDVKAKVDRDTTELTRYVAGEHMDSDDIHLRRWGELNGDYLGPAFHRGFRKGQVLYGFRRTYLKKVAIACFDGICANTTFVLETSDPKVFLPELLPFIMLTDDFTQHSIRESKGSVNPYINWKDIAKYQFPLPPMDEQRRIAEILWAGDEAIEAWTNCHIATTELYQSMLKDVFESNDHRWPKRTLESVARVERGKFDHRPRNLPEFYGGPHPFVQTGDVQRANRILSSFEYTLTDLGVSHSKLFPTGTILVSIAAVIGATAISDRPVYVTDSVVGVVSSSEMNVDFLELFLRSRRSYLENQAATQTAQKNINLQVLRPLEVPCPPLAEQAELATRILATWDAGNRLKGHASTLRAMAQRVRDASLGAIDVH